MQPALAWTFMAAPGATMSATVCWPSTVRSPAGVFELIRSVELLSVNLHDGPTTYQSGSLAVSTSISKPNVRHGSRPIVVQSEVGAPTPGLETPTLGPE